MKPAKGSDGVVLPLYKLLLIGDSSTGKTSLLRRFVDDSFTPSFVSTIGIDFKVKTVTMPSDGTTVKIQVWDTAGQERFRTITSAYYRGAHGVLIVFDVTKTESFEHVRDVWIPAVQKEAASARVIVLVGNKCDLVNERVVSARTKARPLAEQHGYHYVDASALSGEGVEDVFMDMASKIHEIGTAVGTGVQTTVVELTTNENKKGGCC